MSEQKIVVRRKLFDKQSVFFILLHLALFGGTLGALWTLRSAPASSGAGDVDRELGARLKAAGLGAAAMAAYGRVLDRGEVTGPERAKLAYATAELARELGRYEEALARYYEVELADPGGPLKGEVGPKVVLCLERLGKVGAADQALASRAGRAPATASGSKVIARIGSDEITLADVDAAMSVLPPQVQAELSKHGKKEELARRVVAEELLYRKAKKLELDKDPQVRREVDQIGRQLVVQRLVEREVIAKLKVDPKDLENFHKANEARFGKKKLADVRAEVEQAYRQEKIQAGYQAMIEEALKGAEVKLFLDQVGGR